MTMNRGHNLEILAHNEQTTAPFDVAKLSRSLHKHGADTHSQHHHSAHPQILGTQYPQVLRRISLSVPKFRPLLTQFKTNFDETGGILELLQCYACDLFKTVYFSPIDFSTPQRMIFTSCRMPLLLVIAYQTESFQPLRQPG